MSDNRPSTNARPRPNVNQNGKRRANDEVQDDLPQPYNASSLQPVKRRAVSPSEQPRKQKRPGARARISESQREAIQRRQVERDRESASVHEDQNNMRGNHDVVRQHYNSVPERGREWRTRDSKIKGLRVFNNWIKSCIIQRYSPDEDHTPGSRESGRSSGKELLVLDMGCGKGGDLNKWQSAPQPVQLYVGLDPADVSITQARDRFRNLSSRGGRGGHNRRPPPRLFDGRFYVKDCFGETIESLEIIQQVGFDPSPMNRRGFDVVSMMFSMHYAFESETNARNMLRNVAGALKKGGRFIGCIPNSDVLGEHVRKWNEEHAAKKAAAEEAKNNGSGADEEPAEEKEEGEADDDEPPAEPSAEWGNSIYRVRFPGKTPEDGIFRPAFGWKYNFFLDEAVEEVPEYVVPWEAFRALAEDFNLELQFQRPFLDIWEAEKDDREMGPLSERMGVRERGGGSLLISDEEKEAASFYLGFCFYKV
ncbi:unnamed protein product [Clonostachys solani]|uniref:mRNA cap guanine-N(7) methyltransferase n=1 Tax=Clonostachys solani TaxID=160281 RepID=A0A9N9ZB22_9HYPO|nr:unnamed protein product [Clonostachys solani]